MATRNIEGSISGIVCRVLSDSALMLNWASGYFNAKREDNRTSLLFEDYVSYFLKDYVAGFLFRGSALP